MKEKYICFQFSLVVRRSYGHVLENMEFFNTTLSRQILPREYINQIKIVLDCLKQYIGVNLVKKTYNCQKNIHYMHRIAFDEKLFNFNALLYLTSEIT